MQHQDKPLLVILLLHEDAHEGSCLRDEPSAGSLGMYVYLHKSAQRMTRKVLKWCTRTFGAPHRELRRVWSLGLPLMRCRGLTASILLDGVVGLSGWRSACLEGLIVGDGDEVPPSLCRGAVTGDVATRDEGMAWRVGLMVGACCGCWLCMPTLDVGEPVTDAVTVTSPFLLRVNGTLRRTFCCFGVCDDGDPFMVSLPPSLSEARALLSWLFGLSGAPAMRLPLDSAQL